MYLKSFDETVGKFCLERGIRYTRYADDLTFSGRKNDLDLVEYIQNLLFKLDLQLNKEKENLMERNTRQLVTGIVVNDKLQIPKTDRNFIRMEVHYLTKFGLSEHLTRTNNTRSNYMSHLLGKINYALHVNPKDEKMMAYKTAVLKLMND